MCVQPTQPILPVKVSTIIDTMLNFDGHGDVLCKETFSPLFLTKKNFDNWLTVTELQDRSKGNEKVSVPPSLEACLGIRVRISSHSWRSFCKLAPAPTIIKFEFTS